MNFIVKHTLRSARANIIQIAVIIVAVIISSVMIFASFSMSDTFYNINMAEYDRTAQGADMLIGGNNGGSATFSRAKISEYLDNDDVEYAEYFLKLTTVMRTQETSKAVLVEATNLSEYLDKHTINYIARCEDAQIECQQAIIGETMAKECGINVGDEVDIYLASYGTYSKLKITYIAENKGIFGNAMTTNILVDFDAVASKGQASAVYVSFSDSVDDADAKIKEYATTIQQDLPFVNVKEGNDFSEVKEYVSQNTLLFVVGLIFIVATMMLILLTSYQIIARNRMNEMVIFKSGGATPVQVAGIMIVEVVLYALVGTAFGLLLGRLAMQIVTNSLLEFSKYAITYDIWKYIASAFLTIMVTVLACLVPIISTSKKTIREMTDGKNRIVKNDNKLIPFIVSTVLLIGISVAINYVSGIILTIFAGVLLVILVCWITFSVGYVIKLVGFITKKIFKSGVANVAGRIAPRNKAIKTVTILVSVLIAFSFMVVQVVGMVKTAVSPFRDRYDVDIVAEVGEKSSAISFATISSDIARMNGVKSCGYINFYGYYYGEDYDFPIYGVSDYQMLEICASGGLSDGTKDKWDNTQNPLVLSEDMSLRLNKKIGDTIILKPTGDEFKETDVTITFTIVGIDYTTSEYDQIAYCLFETNEQFMPSSGTTFLIDTDGDTTPFIRIREYFDELPFGQRYVLPADQWAHAGKLGVDGVSTLLSIVQISIYFVSVLGMLNIAVVTLFDRKKEFEGYGLCGMSNKDYILFSLSEGMIIGVSGLIMGLISSVVLNMVIPVLGTLINRYLNFGILPVSALVTAVICFAVFNVLWLTVAIIFNKKKKFTINEKLF